MEFLKSLLSFFLSLFKRKQTKEEAVQKDLENKANDLKKEIKDLDKKIEENKKPSTDTTLEDELNYWKNRDNK